MRSFGGLFIFYVLGHSAGVRKQGNVCVSLACRPVCPFLEGRGRVTFIFTSLWYPQRALWDTLLGTGLHTSLCV